VPVVATTGGALPEVVGPDGESARTVAPGDPSALAAALIEVLSDEQERARLGESGRVRVLERFTWRAHAIGLIEMWRAELAEQRSRRAHADR
jgi:glycosyltransferase involved in cell wall biosynthesis